MKITNAFTKIRLDSEKSTRQTITEKIRNAIDNNQYACGVFLDFQKAFDTVNHRILPSKLEYYGIRGIPHDIIKHLNQHTWYTTKLSSWATLIPDIYK